jgi:hypothetical protein
MPRQNRVTPFGELIAAESRGTLMGNRGCLHDRQEHIRRAFAGKRWIICVLEFRGRHRTVMTPGRYTELFFLDEATALAAGHRPCAECQRARYLLFRETWAAANAGFVRASAPSTNEIDSILHAERLDDERGKRTYRAPLSELPAGVMVADSMGVPYLVLEEQLTLWEPGGYGRRIPTRSGDVFQVLTPPSVVRALARGYPVMIHPSAGTTAYPSG